MSALESYLECALWSSTGDDDEPLDDVYGILDFTPAAIYMAGRDVDSFTKLAGDMVNVRLKQVEVDGLVAAVNEGRPYADRVLSDFLLDHGVQPGDDPVAAATSYAIGVPELDEDKLGHYFWLNRNGHGTGFWDNPEFFGALADPLSDLAHKFGECSVLVARRGKVEFFCG